MFEPSPRRHPARLPAHRRQERERATFQAGSSLARRHRRASSATPGEWASTGTSRSSADHLRPAGPGRDHLRARPDGRRLQGLPRAGASARAWPTSACACGRRRGRSCGSCARWRRHLGPDRQGHDRSTPSPATSRPAPGRRARAATTTSASRCRPPTSATRSSPPASAWWSTASHSRSRWCGRCGPRTWRCPRGSTRTWPTTPGRKSWPTPSSRGSRPASRATRRRRPCASGRAVQLAHALGQRGHGPAAPEGGRRRRPGHRNGSARGEPSRPLDEMALDTRSTRTVRVTARPPAGNGDQGGNPS